MNYTVDYFIKKFEAIPEYDFGSGSISSHCIYWHCDYTCSYKGQIANALTEIFDKAFGIIPDRNGNKQYFVYEINDGFNPSYQQPTPKQRILAALADIKKLQKKETPAPQKPKYRTVVINSKVKELTKEKIFQS